MTLRNFGIFLALILAYALACGLKTRAFWQAPGFEAGQRTMYWTESAMHYYMAQKVARGESLFERDEKAQSPEGIVLARDIAPAMPWIAGQLYRWLSPAMPLDIFIGSVFVFYSSLTVIAVFLWGRLLFGWPAGLFSAFLFAVAAPTFVRSAGAFIKEDMALPFLLLGFYLLVRGRGFWAAASVGLALLSWHFSSFVLLCFNAGLVLSAWRFGPNPQVRPLAIFTAGLALIGFISPMLRATAFVFSPAMSVLYALLIWQWRQRFMWAAAAGVFSLAIYFGTGLAEQSHVFGLVIDKIRFGLTKPTDPILLSYETRSNWIEDFSSPSLYLVFYFASLYLPLGLLGLALTARQKNREAWLIATVGFIFLIFFVLVRRMITIDIAYLCIAMGALLRYRWGWVALAVTLSYEGWKSYHYFEPNPVAVTLSSTFPENSALPIYTVREHQDLIYWLRANTEPQDSILTSMGFSPVVLAYADRPIVIHSMFDAKAMRDKVQAYTEALFATEDAFYAFAQKNGVKYFIYESKTLLENGPDPAWYMAGKPGPHAASAAFLFQFRPAELRHFQLVYQNTAYRVYRVGEAAAPRELIAQPVYDEGVLRSHRINELAQFTQNVTENMARGFVTAPDIAIQLWEEVLRRAPYTLDIHAHLCLAYLIVGRIEVAGQHCQTQLKQASHSPIGHYHQGLYLEKSGQIVEARREYERALQIDPRYKAAARRLGP